MNIIKFSMNIIKFRAKKKLLNNSAPFVRNVGVADFVGSSLALTNRAHAGASQFQTSFLALHHQ